MCRGRGAVVFCPGGRLVFQRSWGGSESEEPAERNLASVSCHRWLLSESARISLCVVSTRRSQPIISVATFGAVVRMGWNYALALYRDNGATLDDLHEAVSTLESVARLWTRIFGEAHPETPKVQGALEVAREKLADARAAASNKSKPPL